jgi:CheY-like chemotaxis protein
MPSPTVASQNDRAKPQSIDQPEIVLSPGAEAGLDRLASVLDQHEPASCILLVEDNPADVFLIETAFRLVDEKLRVSLVGGVAEAINYLDGNMEFADRSQHPIPGAILLDLGLPDNSGLEVLKHIRSSPHLQSTIVIAITGSDSEPNALKAQTLGINAYLQKPNSGSYEELIRDLRCSGLL